MKHQRPRRATAGLLSLAAIALLAVVFARQLGAQGSGAAAYEFNDSHFHLTNYIQ
jgi:hypothetical protein